MLFELKGCWELIRKFTYKLHVCLANFFDTNEKACHTCLIKKILRDQDQSWFKLLERARNFFIHGGTPYIAIDVTDPQNWGLLIMKENLREFSNPDKYFIEEEIYKMGSGFLDAERIIENYFIDMINSSNNSKN